jgi:hypothetical protein
MALATSSNYYTTRDDIIKRALRIIGAISQGETPSATAVTEAAITLNEVFKEWQADGLQLWKRATLPLNGFTVGTSAVTLQSNGAPSNLAPSKIIDIFYKNTASGQDTTLTHMTYSEYVRFTPKATSYSTPTQWYYQTPGAKDSAVYSGGNWGVLTFFPGFSTTFITDNTIYIVGIYPFYDFDTSSDQPDLPDYLINALVWALADQLAYEYGVALQERDRITKKAMFHKAVALSFDQEEGSLFFRPETFWNE